MRILIKVFTGSVIGVFTIGMLGCGCLFPSTPSNTLMNLYIDLHTEAEFLRYDGKYREAIEKYEQAFKIRPRPTADTKVIDVSYLTLFKYRIAFCYAKLAETERDVSLYIKAEEVVKESYQAAILRSDQIGVLYLWGCILFNQERYAEARSKFEELLEISLQRGFHDIFAMNARDALRKTYLELGDEAATPRAFGQLEERLKIALQNRVPDRFLEVALYRLGEMHLELGDETAARRAFGQLEALLETSLQGEVRDRSLESFSYFHYLGGAYLELGDTDAARRAFGRFEELLDTFVQQGSGDVSRERFWDFYYLGESYLKLGDKVAALRVFRRFEELFETSLERGVDDSLAYILSTLGESYLELGDKAAALRIFRRFEEVLEIALQREDRERSLDYDLYRLGVAYMELGEEASAQKVFVELLEHFPDSLFKAKAEGFLGR